jgi:hypothetical protein
MSVSELEYLITPHRRLAVLDYIPLDNLDGKVSDKFWEELIVCFLSNMPFYILGLAQTIN